MILEATTTVLALLSAGLIIYVSKSKKELGKKQEKINANSEDIKKLNEAWTIKYQELLGKAQKLVDISNEKNEKQNLLIKQYSELKNKYENGVFYSKEDDRILEIKDLERLGDLEDLE